MYAFRSHSLRDQHLAAGFVVAAAPTVSRVNVRSAAIAVVAEGLVPFIRAGSVPIARFPLRVVTNNARLAQTRRRRRQF